MTDEISRDDALLEAEWALECGNLERTSSNYDKALEMYAQAITIFQKHGDRHGQGKALGQAAGVLTVRNKLDQALQHYRQALSIHQETGNQRQEGETLSNMGIALRHKGDWDQAIVYYQRALTIHQSLNNKRYEGITLIGLGTAFRQMGQYDAARDTYQQALEVSRSYGDRRSEGAIQNNLGLIARVSDDDLTAIAHFEQALVIHKECGNVENEAITLGNIGDSLVALQRAGEAKTFLKQAIDLGKRIDFLLPASVFAGSLALLLAKEGQAKAALELLCNAEDALRKHSLEHAKFLCKATIVYAKCGQPEDARQSMKQAESLAAKLDATENQGLTKLLGSARASLHG